VILRTRRSTALFAFSGRSCSGPLWTVEGVQVEQNWSTRRRPAKWGHRLTTTDAQDGGHEEHPKEDHRRRRPPLPRSRPSPRPLRPRPRCRPQAPLRGSAVRSRDVSVWPSGRQPGIVEPRYNMAWFWPVPCPTTGDGRELGRENSAGRVRTPSLPEPGFRRNRTQLYQACAWLS